MQLSLNLMKFIYFISDGMDVHSNLINIRVNGCLCINKISICINLKLIINPRSFKINE